MSGLNSMVSKAMVVIVTGAILLVLVLAFISAGGQQAPATGSAAPAPAATAVAPAPAATAAAPAPAAPSAEGAASAPAVAPAAEATPDTCAIYWAEQAAKGKK